MRTPCLLLYNLGYHTNQDTFSALWISEVPLCTRTYMYQIVQYSDCIVSTEEEAVESCVGTM